MKRWYAVYCKPQQDARAEMHLRNQSFEVFRPLLQLRRRYGSRYKTAIESMFPRYLFIRLDALAQWGSIRSTRGVMDFVRRGENPSWVPDPVILELRQRVGSGGCLILDEGLQPGKQIRILDGPFSGCEALFDGRTGEERVMVLLEIMQKPQQLILPEVSIACV